MSNKELYKLHNHLVFSQLVLLLEYASEVSLPGILDPLVERQAMHPMQILLRSLTTWSGIDFRGLAFSLFTCSRDNIYNWGDIKQGQIFYKSPKEPENMRDDSLPQTCQKHGSGLNGSKEGETDNGSESKGLKEPATKILPFLFCKNADSFLASPL